MPVGVVRAAVSYLAGGGGQKFPAGDANEVDGGRACPHSNNEELMSSSAYYPARVAAPSVIDRLRSDPTYQGYLILRVGFAVAPILFGLDKFANVLVDWKQYLAPWVIGLLPIGAAAAMQVIGVVEIAAGIAVAVKPRFGAYLVAAWLGGIIVNLVTYPGYFDIALRDFGLLLGALALARLAARFDSPATDPWAFVRRGRSHDEAVS